MGLDVPTLKAGLAGLAMAFAMPLASAQQGRPALSMQLDGEIQIAQDGSVQDYKAHATLPAPIAQLIEKSVRGWHFEPVVVNGLPVTASTVVHLDLSAEPIRDTDDFRLRVVSVHFGDPARLGKIALPEYPADAARAALEARVMLFLQLDASGKVVNAETYQTSLGARARSEREAEIWRKRFERASISAAMKWHYNLSEKVNGQTIGSSVLVPVVFSMSRSDDHDRWKAFVPGPVHTGLWAAQLARPSENSLTGISDGNALSIDSQFRLKDDVVGKML